MALSTLSFGQRFPPPVVYFRFLYTSATLIIAFTSAGECCQVGGRDPSLGAPGSWAGAEGDEQDTLTPTAVQRTTGFELKRIFEGVIAGL